MKLFGKKESPKVDMLALKTEIRRLYNVRGTSIIPELYTLLGGFHWLTLEDLHRAQEEIRYEDNVVRNFRRDI